MAKKINGIVSSDVRDKTITVTVTTRKTHPIYGKSYIVSKKFTAHDEKNEAKVGDKVIIIETKPISKTKRFALDSIVERGHQTIEIAKTEIEEEAEAKVAEREARSAAKKVLEVPVPVASSSEATEQKTNGEAKNE